MILSSRNQVLSNTLVKDWEPTDCLFLTSIGDLAFYVNFLKAFHVIPNNDNVLPPGKFSIFAPSMTRWFFLKWWGPLMFIIVCCGGIRQTYFLCALALKTHPLQIVPSSALPTLIAVALRVEIVWSWPSSACPYARFACALQCARTLAHPWAHLKGLNVDFLPSLPIHSDSELLENRDVSNGPLTHMLANSLTSLTQLNSLVQFSSSPGSLCQREGWTNVQMSWEN